LVPHAAVADSAGSSTGRAGTAAAGTDVEADADLGADSDSAGRFGAFFIEGFTTKDVLYKIAYSPHFGNTGTGGVERQQPCG
jgi:hypothetical protein